MYGFENDYDFYPATESNAITEFFSNVWEKIKEFGAKIKEWAGKIKEKIKYLLKTKKEKIEANDKMLTDKVAAVDKDVLELLTHCSEYFLKMQGAFNRVAKDDKTETFDEIKDDLSNETIATWNKTKTEVISGLTKDTEIIKRVKENLSEIKHVGMATKGALENAYKTLTEMYSVNGKNGTYWASIMKFKEACTGEMKSLLGKVVSVYDALKSAATALMNKLISGKFVDEADSKKTAKELKSYRKGENEYYIGRKDLRTSNKKNDIKENDSYKKLGKGLAGDRKIDYYAMPDGGNGELKILEGVGTLFDFSDFDDDISVTEAAAYENGYEQAIQDMAVFNAIPDASEEFDW